MVEVPGQKSQKADHGDIVAYLFVKLNIGNRNFTLA